jgi:type VI secretion system protein ImpG
MQRYYQEHLAFLAHGGKRLAEAFPRAAERLAAQALDPDVERLLEGIAYITGSIEEKHDRSLPEVCQLVFDTLFPHYLTPLPSTGVVQFEGSQPVLVTAGSPLESDPVAGTPCRFRTIYDVEAGSVTLQDVLWQPGARQCRLQLQLELRADLPVPETLRLHLHGEPLITRSLFAWLQTRLDGIELLDSSGKAIGQRGSLRLKPLGFGEDEQLFPYPDGSFDGFRLVQEYFVLPQKFMFVELLGLREALGGKKLGKLGVRFDLRVDGARLLSVGPHNFRLGCTPVVNLFEHSADPLVRRPGRLDYLVRPAGPHGHYDTYRVVAVSGYSPDGITPYPIISELDLEQSEQGFCQLHRRELHGQLFVYFSVNDGERPPPERQTLLCDLLASNGILPMALRAGDRCRTIEAAPAPARLITPPTRPATVGVGESLPMRLATHLALSQRDLTSLAALRDLLTLYNFPAVADAQAARAQRLLRDGLLEAQTKLCQHQYHRVPIWGRSTLVTIEESAFDTEGELYLFGSVMNEVIALQAGINTFSEFSLRGARSQEVTRWPRRLGRRLLDPSA